MVGMLVLQAREKQLEVTLALRRLGAHLTGSRFGFTSLPTGKTAGQTLACHLFQTASGATQDALFLQRDQRGLHLHERGRHTPAHWAGFPSW